MLRVNPTSWLLGTLAIALFACAQGTSLTDSGSSGNTTSGNGSSGSTGGAGGSGGGDTTASTTATTTTSTTSATTGSGGAPPMCSEDPCKLVSPQCGCPDGQQCSVGANGRFCTGQGAEVWGDECGGVAGACEPGTLCVLTKQTTPTVSTCAKFCEDDADCQAPGGICILTLNDGNGGTVPNATLCTQNCDPISNTGCGAPNTACQVGQEQAGLMRIFSICGGAGAGTQNSTCVATNDDCAPGFGCFDVGNPSDVCLKWCNVNSPACSGGTTCVALNINGQNVQIGAVQYGACL